MSHLPALGKCHEWRRNGGASWKRGRGSSLIATNLRLIVTHSLSSYRSAATDLKCCSLWPERPVSSGGPRELMITDSGLKIALIKPTDSEATMPALRASG